LNYVAWFRDGREVLDAPERPGEPRRSGDPAVRL
jgi:hypothetical protein